MKYRVMCLTPTLVGDGQKLSPIDYMVWRDHVNVLDQRRIFKLLAKGPRLDGYLAQIKKADRLDFASWGGFAQNFAGRRIPFESPAAVPVWQRAQAEQLFIPTFAASLNGPYLPATSIKGALAHRRGLRTLDRSYAQRFRRKNRGGTPASQSGNKARRCAASQTHLRWRFSRRRILRHEGLPAASVDLGRARRRQA